MKPTPTASVALVSLALLLPASAAPREPLPWKAPARWTDAVELPAPAAVKLEGFLGLRVANNEAHRLALVDETPLLAGFRQRPGNHPWIGEHVGKWLHAAVLAWSYTGDDQLESKITRVATELIKCQEPDGYLGTYKPDQRFGLYRGADWDVWSHKYNLLGLLTYYQYTGDEAALACCRRIGDLLIQTFGPDRKSILSAGTHVGMAATSVLEPMVLLYRATGDERYLGFSRYLVQSWDAPNGPKIITALLQSKSVQKTANAKAYEMLSNLVGLCELVRATNDRQLLEPVLIAWQDIVQHRLYLTGSASQGEHFQADFVLPNVESAHVSETCVTTTWIQLNSQLLRLTGEARFANELEKTFLNHLAAAQRPDGAEWCYFTALEGKKPYGPGINCCVSSGPRGMALVPQMAILRSPPLPTHPETALVNLFESSRAGLTLDRQDVILEVNLDNAQPGRGTILIHTEQPARFALGIRTPAWALPLELTTDRPGDKAFLKEGWTVLPPRPWRDGDQVKLSFSWTGRRIDGDHGNAGRAALMWGPAVLAYDEAFNRELGPFAGVALAESSAYPPVSLKSLPDGSALFEAPVRSRAKPGVHMATFVTFADAGSQGSRYQVWLRGPQSPLPTNESKFFGQSESRSHPGNQEGSIVDGDAETFVVTFDSKPQNEAWFAVHANPPAEFNSIVFCHGNSFHDGGWFDTSASKPRVEIQRSNSSPWEIIGLLDAYPATTSTQAPGLAPATSFTLKLPNLVRATSLRVIGRPASGDGPTQAFASCAELQAFAK